MAIIHSENGKPINETNPLYTSVTGSLANGADGNDILITGTDIKGKAASKPLASAYPFYTYWSVDTDPHADAVEVSDGTNWVVM